MTATWAPGDRFQLAARGDRYDGVTGRVRKVFVSRGDHVHVTHDDGTITSWPIARLVKPVTDSADHTSSSQAGLASLIPSTGAVTAPTPSPVDAAAPSLVEPDRRGAADRLSYWAERALATLDSDSLLAGHLLEAITAYREVSR